MKKTQSGRKQFTTQEKLDIIAECQDNGIKVTCAKYGIYPSSYYYWKSKILSGSDNNLSHGNYKKDRSRFKTLEKELETLKILLAEEKLQSRLKDDLLEKKYPELKK